ncbi:hypothetical protein BJ138DRAFT_153194 [Hygrophoropsis aurantiaca]|uniref:Uncharacterized protein n=1 Tax=Hygrophoropsis aurantiaca TaxID=72124 RepID=A0ACB8A9X6_9AGAM|nr:hypothetical protein BJ138DRAFT_153194 [Hygrophoropsis aurantiaca]
MTVPAGFMLDVWVRRFFGTAGYTFLIWDHILTLDQEVQYIWKTNWTISKTTFLLNRYINLAFQTFICIEETGILSHGSHQWCVTFKIATITYIIFALESIHVLVLMRAWAIWGCRRRIMIWLVVIYMVYLLILVALTSYEAHNVQARQFKYLDDLGICVGFMPVHAWTLFTATFALDTAVFIITMRSLRRYSRICRHLYPSTLLHRLFRDGTWLYFYRLSFLFFLTPNFFRLKRLHFSWLASSRALAASLCGPYMVRGLNISFLSPFSSLSSL